MIYFELPYLPKRQNQKLGRHWSYKHKEVTMLMSAISALTAKQRPEKPFKHAKISMSRFSSSPPDYDGLVDSFKTTVDCLIKLGIIEDDSMFNIGKPDYDWRKAKKNEGKIAVSVIEITDPEILKNHYYIYKGKK